MSESVKPSVSQSIKLVSDWSYLQLTQRECSSFPRKYCSCSTRPEVTESLFMTTSPVYDTEEEKLYLYQEREREREKE